MNLLKALATISSLTMLSRITGLVREILIARAFGASDMTDAFNVAFRIPNLLRRIFAEGAFSQAFVPILNEYHGKRGHDETMSLVDAVATVMTWVLAAVSLLGVIGAPIVMTVVATGFRGDSETYNAAVFMTRVMFPYIGLISMVALASGILNTWRNFAVPAFTPVLLNLCLIVAALFVGPHMSQPIYAQAWGVLVGGVLQLVIQVPAMRKLGVMPRVSLNLRAAWANPGVRRVITQMLPALLAVSVAQISLIINTNIASRLGAGAVSYITYADRLMEFPTALLGVALGTILLPSLSRASAEDNREEYSGLLDWGLRLTFLLALPCAAGLMLFGTPITSVLFHYGRFDAHAVEMTQQALTTYGVGLLALILIKILTPGFYARQDIRTPVKIAILVLIITQASNYVFVPMLQHAGLPLSISFGATVNALLLFYGLRRRGYYHPAPGWGLFLLRLVAAMLILSGMLLWFARNFDWIALGATPGLRIALMGACLVLAATVYFGTLWLMGLRYSSFRRRAG
ncbi:MULTISPECIES: murein biosynthesis integral membrane protein MurJ [Cupriavidus]|uniref:murein biosynthesis integral membrane protein MurJ n=1 Tax=Cupriavidus TaxID=106589 RepID=UPI00003C3A74|nr:MULTISPECIES: murein biosynthesis integral membrane protein MurJ [Cupriavidus]AVA36909.1 murein biosynthesis integral membrane protein MurJ [Cupriavidus metallidurans]EKZ99306.1 Integral membrane protein MviN [Cupriavidus sp. HMR-1]QGS29392.1 murein biosynthesis integral membrane protein MurJ [Cupriavidus metallidurans]UBM10430.1 murein biosynthesis integral membrane protein MurJ [Cupriavidus metallidurans]